MAKKTVALTGGTGFVGGALIDHLHRQGYSLKALVRDRERLGDRAGKVQAITGDLDTIECLAALAQGADFFVHCAGVTMAQNDDDYRRVNVLGAQNAAIAAANAGARFVHISSISAQCKDVSAYARSKYDSEKAVLDVSGENGVIVLRGPAIYGPGDRVTLPYFKLVKSGIAAEPATPMPARASILYVDDMATAIETVFAEGTTGAIYEIGDGKRAGHEWQEIGKTLGDVLGVRVHRLRAPRAALEIYHWVLRSQATLMRSTPSVRTGQLNEFFHADWAAKENLLSDATSWRPMTSLREGLIKTASWYQEQGWLKA